MDRKVDIRNSAEPLGGLNPVSRRIFLFVTLTTAAIFCICRASHPRSFDVSVLTQGWGTLRIDRSVEDTPLSIRGVPFSTGLGTHAHSRIIIRPNGEYRRFSGGCGVDDETAGMGSITCAVRAGGAMVFQSGLVTGRSDAVWFDVPVDGQKEVVLEVTDYSDGGGFDHADWVNLLFTR